MLRRVFKVRQGTVWFRTGHIYQFNYKTYEHDPKPTVIALYAVRGDYQKTGKTHNYLCGINLNYISRNDRKTFIKLWIQILEKYKGNTILTWEMVKRRFPYLQLAFRRYVLDTGSITQHKEIPLNKIWDVVVSSLTEDYSRQAKIALVSKYKSIRKLGEAKIKDINKSIFGGDDVFGQKGALGGKV